MTISQPKQASEKIRGLMRNPIKLSLVVILFCVLLGVAWVEIPGLLLSNWCSKCNDFKAWQGKDSDELVKKFGRPTHVFPASEEILSGTAFHAVGGNLTQEWLYKPQKMYFQMGVADGKVLAADRYDHRHLLNSLFFGEYFDTMAASPLKKER